MKKISALLITVIIIIVLGISFILRPKNNTSEYIKYDHEILKANCEDSEGVWSYSIAPNGTDTPSGYCYHPPSDAGKTCYQDSECNIDCISTNKVDEEGYILGKCGEYDLEKCTPTIPNKTKSRDTLNQGSCI